MEAETQAFLLEGWIQRSTETIMMQKVEPTNKYLKINLHRRSRP